MGPSICETVDGLDDEGAIQWVRQRAPRRKTPGRVGIGRESRVPDDIQVVADLGNPVESQIEIRATLLVLVLREREEVSTRIERILHTIGPLSRAEPAARQSRGRHRVACAQNEVSAAAQRY